MQVSFLNIVKIENFYVILCNKNKTQLYCKELKWKNSNYIYNKLIVEYFSI